MKKTLIVLALLLAGCGSDGDSPFEPPVRDAQFVYRGLEGLTIVDLEQAGDTLVAATDAGIYKYIGADNWVLETPQTWVARAIVVLSPTHLLASIRTQTDTYRMAESLNGGDDWVVVETDFGGVQGEQIEPMGDIAFDAATGALYATGWDVLAVSLDFGRSWTVVDGAWQNFATGMSALAYSAQNGDTWYGGQDALESARLHRLDGTTGTSTDMSSDILEWLKAPSTVEGIAFYPQAEHIVFASGEGGVVRSADYGASWQPVLVNGRSRFYYDVIIDSETGVVYSGGWDKNFDDPQPLILEISDDNGLTWQAYEYTGADIRGGIWSLKLGSFNNEKRLFVGLQGGGVYEVELEHLND